MLNNKGFAISSILYLLLIAFLMFLMVTLAQFLNSTSIIGKANDDLINGTKFEAIQIKDSKKECVSTKKNKNGNQIYWYESGDGELLVRIKSRYGTMYWPKDFGLKVNQSNGNIEGSYHSNKNIDIYCLDGSNCEGKNIFNIVYSNQTLNINLTESESSIGGKLSISGEDFLEFQNAFNQITLDVFENNKTKYDYDFYCSTKKYKNINKEECDDFFKKSGINKIINSNGEIKFLFFSSEWIYYGWNLEKPIKISHTNAETNEVTTSEINNILYSYIVSYETEPSIKKLIGNTPNNLNFYNDDIRLFVYNRDALQEKINNLGPAEIISSEQKLKIKDKKTGSAIENFGLYDICE